MTSVQMCGGKRWREKGGVISPGKKGERERVREGKKRGDGCRGRGGRLIRLFNLCRYRGALSRPPAASAHLFSSCPSQQKSLSAAGPDAPADRRTARPCWGHRESWAHCLDAITRRSPCRNTLPPNPLVLYLA